MDTCQKRRLLCPLDNGGRAAPRASAMLLCMALAASAAIAKQRPLQPAKTASPKPQIVTRPAPLPFSFQVERNLVLVRVVVRDKQGHVVENLRKGDFRLFDNGKLQQILQFSVKRHSARPAASASAQKPAVRPETALAPWRPAHFLALYFDDVHMHAGSIMRVRLAVDHYLASTLAPSDRVGLFTASGRDSIGFTQNVHRVEAALARMTPQSIVPVQYNPCPRIYQYQAYLIVDRRDSNALEEATQEALLCRYGGDTRFLNQAANDAKAAAFTVLNNSQTQADYSLRGLGELVRRMSALPGQRTIALISPGFLIQALRFQLESIVDQALRSNITINTLDSRGLATEVPFDNVSQQTIIIPNRPDLMGQKAIIKLNEFSYEADVMRDLARGTGGVYFHNNNDLAEGFREVSSMAPTYYLLAFSPNDLKPNGSFHRIKVRIRNGKDLLIEARRGYFAPRRPQNTTQAANAQIRQAVFSPAEILQLPIEVHTQFFKSDPLSARLAVLTHLDLQPLNFIQKDGRNWNKLAFVTAVFDRNGRCVAAKEKLVTLRLLDGVLGQLRQSGITVRSTFNVPPGSYVVRQVVRDEDAGEISGVNRTIRIPY